MARDYNINISVQGGNRRGAFGGGNLVKTKSTLNSFNKPMSSGGEDVSSYNLSRLFSVGLIFNKSQQFNELAGAFTGNKRLQRQINTGMTFAKYGIGLAINPVVGATYAIGDMAYRGISYGVMVQKKNREAEYYRSLSGNNANSGRRYRGDYSWVM